MRKFSSFGCFIPLFWRIGVSVFVVLLTISGRAQSVPLSVQGRVTADGQAFDGVGKFKFALFQSVNGPELWSNDGTGSGTDLQPTGFVSLNVTRGVYSVLLGDTTITGMTQPINASIFTNLDVRLRVWFNDGSHGFQRLNPDQRVAAVGYAMRAEKAGEAAALSGNVTIEQVPSIVVTNNESGVTLTGKFVGDGSLLAGIRGSTPFQIATNGTNIVFPNTGYLTTNAVETVFLLPLTADMRVGDLLRVGAGDPGPWKIAQREGQSIYAGHFQGGIGAKFVARESNRNWNGVASSRDGTNLVAILAGGNPSIYLSTNAGVNWMAPQLPPQQSWNTVAVSADGQRGVVGANNEYLYLSSDQGLTWARRTVPGIRVWSGIALSANGSNIVAVASGAVWGSVDGGENWVVRTPPSSAWRSAATSADGQKQAIGADKIYVSKNGGTNWTTTSPSGTFVGVASSSDGDRIVAVSFNGQIVTSVDGGTNWTVRTGAGTRAWQAVTCSTDGTKIAATVSGGGIYVSVDGGGGWTARASNAAWTDVAMSGDGNRIIATVLAGQIFTSESATVRSTTVGVDGYLVGGEASAVELQHVGNGRFVPRSSSGEIFAY